MAKKYQKNRKVRRLIDVLILLAAAVAIFSAWKLYSNHKEYQIGTDFYNEILQTAAQPQPSQQPVQIPMQVLGQQEEETTPFSVNFDALRQVNRDVAAWIIGAGGQIHYPVVQGSDNDYYLTRLLDGTYNSNGSVFMDYRNSADLSDKNTFIYGHNMRNGAMFAALCNYSDPAYYAANPELVLITPQQSYCLQAFSGYVTTGSSLAYQMTYEDEEAFASYLEWIRSQSSFHSEVPVTPDDQIVTLSTCAYNYEEARFVLHCKLIAMQ